LVADGSNGGEPARLWKAPHSIAVQATKSKQVKFLNNFATQMGG
jgi:hypothetical protein